MRHYFVEVVKDKTYFRKRGKARLVYPDIDRRGVYSVESTYFVVERALVDGSLPSPSREAEDAGWIGTYQWDFLVYMWSNAALGETTRSFSGMKAAYDWCGLNVGVSSTLEKTRRRERLFAGLEEAGLIRDAGRSPGGLRQYWQLMLVPSRTAEGIVPSDEPRTWANLRRPGRPWFRMAFSPMAAMVEVPWRKTRVHQWASLTHEDRRALMALYYFFDPDIGAVDPNHLCLLGDHLRLSDAFLAVCGAGTDPDVACAALGELWREGRSLLSFQAVHMDDGPGFPAADASILHATPVSAGDQGRKAVVRLRYVPKEDESSDYDG